MRMWEFESVSVWECGTIRIYIWLLDYFQVQGLGFRVEGSFNSKQWVFVIERLGVLLNIQQQQTLSPILKTQTLNPTKVWPSRSFLQFLCGLRPNTLWTTCAWANFPDMVHPPTPRNNATTTELIPAMRASPLPWPCPSQRSLHNAPIFRLLLKVAVNGTHQCDFLNFCGDNCAPTHCCE